ncbi:MULTISPECIES: hypothetical protein [Streptomyces]|uniref:hypothetical protein n=1 Tax=Streptomyces TaxID=1883 RepID=UPI00345B84A5
MTAVAILPSRSEAATIADVTSAVDQAIDDPTALIINADCSLDSATTAAFSAVPTRARKLPITHVPAGKGRQVLYALQLVEMPPDTVVLIADTDTRNPEPAMYRALLDAARAGAGCAVADYRRYWDEGNLTHHIARPLLAATGIDLPQPLAGDIALSDEACTYALAHRRDLPHELGECVDGYGIDAFLVTAAARSGQRVTGIPLERTKQHAPSFPHLPAIFQQAVPVLLAVTAERPLRAAEHPGRVAYQLTDRPIPDDRLAAMVTALDRLAPHTTELSADPWPAPLFAAWRATRNGIPAAQAATTLWPFYIERVRTWLTTSHLPITARGARLAEAHQRLVRWITNDTNLQEMTP